MTDATIDPTRQRTGSRTATATLGLLSLLAVGVLLWTWQVVGMTWDDGIELIAMRTELALIRDGAPNYTAAAASIHYLNAYYGIVAAGTAHLLAWALAIEPKFDVSFAAESYRLRHAIPLGSALLATLCLTATVWKLTRKPVLTAAFPAILLWLPMFSGHAAINIKDMPVAAGLSIASCGLALCLDRVWGSRHLVIACSLITLGVFLAMGTRCGIIAPFAVVFLGCAVAAIVDGGRRELIAFAAAAIATTFGMALVMALNPVAWYDPLRWLIDSILVSVRYPGWGGGTVVFSHMVQAREPVWWYVPAWLLVQLPLELMVLLGAGIWGMRRLAWRKALVWLPFLMQGAVLPLLVIIAGSTIFNALRHVLFIAPPIALLGAWGVETIWNSRSSYRWAGLALVAVMAAECSWWAPYQYAAINPIGLAAGGSDAFDGDYWGTSGREGKERLKALGGQNLVVGPGDTGIPYALGKQNGDPDTPDAYYAFAYAAKIGLSGPIHPAYPCRLQFTISRFGFALGQGFVCLPGASGAG